MTIAAVDTDARLDVLGLQRRVRDDEQLTAHQKSFLLCAILRADSRGTHMGKVRASLGQVARDASVGVDAVSGWLRESDKDYSAAVVDHFAAVERPHKRRVDLWFPVS